MLRANNPHRLLQAAFALTMAFFLYNAWVADDAFITFRVVKNAVLGFGLRWNVGERVQVYTHPLWMLAHIPLYWLFGNIFLATIAFSLLLTVYAITMLLRCIPLPPMQTFVFLLLPCALSKTLHEYMVSGMESPMLIALLITFWHGLYHHPEKTRRLLFIAGLALLTRLDTAVLLALPLLWLWRKTRFPLRHLLAFWPLPLWFAFCQLYYGFILPNTLYAKLGTGIAFTDYLKQGAYYLYDFLHYDPFSCLFGLAVLLAAALSLPRRAWDSLAAVNALSILLYLTYIMAIGGDFMAGRFMVVPFFFCLLLLAQIGQGASLPNPRLLPALAGLMIALALAQTALHTPRSIRQIIFVRHGIADEREFYDRTNTLFPLHGVWPLRTRVAHLRRDLQGRDKPEHNVALNGYTGIIGYDAPPRLTIIDWNALSDPLLARIPIPDPKTWRIGHFERAIPPGYIFARQFGFTAGMPQGLRQYYEALRIITTAPVWDMARLKTTLDFNLGLYDSDRQLYLDQMARTSHDQRTTW